MAEHTGEPLRIDWSSAQARGGTLRVALAGEAPRGLRKRAEIVLALIEPKAGGWGEIAVRRESIEVDSLQEGASRRSPRTQPTEIASGRPAIERRPRSGAARRREQMQGDQTVLVTGGSGYLGGWCIVQLLQQGYRVRTTVRSLEREASVREKVGSVVDPGERLQVMAADLLEDRGWTEAVAGCTYVLHVASPFPPAQPKDPDELIVPAREGTLRVLRAALDAGVERIVSTSSVAAVRNGTPEVQGRALTDADWSDPDNLRLTPYTRSKTIAELAAWELVRERGAEQRLATVQPGAIIGPVLGDDRSYSLEVIERLLAGSMPGLPRLGFSFIDVRDVAALHIAAMTAPEAAGRRLLAASDFLWFSDVAKILRERLGEDASKVPTRTIPNFVLRAMALVDPAIRSVSGDLGKKTTFSLEGSEKRTGWKPRPVEDSIVDTARSLLAKPAPQASQPAANTSA